MNEEQKSFKTRRTKEIHMIDMIPKAKLRVSSVPKQNSRQGL